MCQRRQKGLGAASGGGPHLCSLGWVLQVRQGDIDWHVCSSCFRHRIHSLCLALYNIVWCLLQLLRSCLKCGRHFVCCLQAQLLRHTAPPACPTQ